MTDAMSIRYSSAVWKSQIGDPVAKLVMLKLADNANEEGKCWPSIAAICDATGLCERTVQAKTRYLESAGFIATNRGKNRCDYALLMSALKQAFDDSPPRRRCTPQEMHPAGDAPRISLRLTPQEMHPHPAGDAVALLEEPSKNHQRTIADVLPEGWKKLSKTEQGRKKVNFNTPLMIRVGKFLSQRETTLWTIAEYVALQDVSPTDDDLDLIEAHYSLVIENNGYRFKDLLTLLNNWPKARTRAEAYFQEFPTHRTP